MADSMFSGLKTFTKHFRQLKPLIFKQNFGFALEENNFDTILKVKRVQLSFESENALPYTRWGVLRNLKEKLFKDTDGSN